MILIFLLKKSGHLTLKNIIKLDDCLDSYQFFCLLSCETARAGNQTVLTEYVGLASAFLMQEVDQVLGTLWVVESKARLPKESRKIIIQKQRSSSLIFLALIQKKSIDNKLPQI